MKRHLLFAIAIFVLLVCSILPASSSAADAELLRFSAVMPTGTFEGVTVTNYGSNAVDIHDYRISDGEGEIRFSIEMKVEPKGSLSVLKSEPAEWFDMGRYVTFDTEGIVQKGFALRDSGDDVYLFRGDTIADTFVYGDIQTGEGWKGDQFDKIPKNRIAARISMFDTDTAADWSVRTPSTTDFKPTSGFDAEVTPFIFPDSSGNDVFDALSKTDEKICISMYILSHPGIIYILATLLEKGISVEILVDGTPAGGVPEEEISSLSFLEKKGAKIKAIAASDDGFKRYAYLHNKYAVIDDDTTVITSENWVKSSFENNRGWGAVIESEDYADYMADVFYSDFNCGFDTVGFTSLFKTNAIYRCHHFDFKEGTDISYNAKVFPIISPDSSFVSMKEMIASSSVRIYSEQLSVQYSWLTDNDNPLQWMIGAGNNGADSRIIIDTSFDSRDDTDYYDGYGLCYQLSFMDGIFAKTSNEDGPMIHNKGIVCDDKVWVGSVNWTENSLRNNREAAVIIDSPEIADYFADSFISDWGDEYAGRTVIDIGMNTGSPTAGESFMLDASSSVAPEGSSFEWDTDDDGIIDRWGETIAVRLSAGTHIVHLTIVSMDGSEYMSDFKVEVGSVSNFDYWSVLKFLPFVVLGIIVLSVNHIRRRRDSDDGKRVQNRGSR